MSGAGTPFNCDGEAFPQIFGGQSPTDIDYIEAIDMHEFTGTVVAAGSFSDPALGRDQFGAQNTNIFQDENPMMLVYPNVAVGASSFWTINTG